MKIKDIVVIIVAILLVGASGYFIYKTLKPTSNQPSKTDQTTVENTISKEEYDKTLKLISEKKDYGEATLDNIGRTNPFGPLN